nr:ORF I polyprotein [Ipomoea batatas]
MLAATRARNGRGGDGDSSYCSHRVAVESSPVLPETGGGGHGKGKARQEASYAVRDVPSYRRKHRGAITANDHRPTSKLYRVGGRSTENRGSVAVGEATAIASLLVTLRNRQATTFARSAGLPKRLRPSRRRRELTSAAGDRGRRSRVWVTVQSAPSVASVRLRLLDLPERSSHATAGTEEEVCSLLTGNPSLAAVVSSERSKLYEVYMFSEGSSSQSTSSNADFPPDIDVNQFPWSHEYLEERRTDWEVRLFRYHGGHMLQHMVFTLNIHLLKSLLLRFKIGQKSKIGYFGILCHEYHILMEFHRPSLRKELDLSVEKDLIKFLTWFYPLKYWKKLCQDGPEFFTVHLHREVTAWVSRFLEGHAEPFMKIYEQHMESIIVREEDYPELQRYIFTQNKVIPKEIWPREGIQPDVRQDDEIYHERIKSARNQYYYELSQVKKEDIWSQDPWNFEDINSVLEEVEKIEKAYAQKSRKKRPEHKSQWNKDGWRTKRRQSGMDRQEWVNYIGYPSYSNYSTESDTASHEDSVMDLQFHGEWMVMKTKQPDWDPQNWKGKRFMNEG